MTCTCLGLPLLDISRDCPTHGSSADALRARLAAAWDEGHRTRDVPDPDADCRCEAWSEGECACGEYGRTIPAPNPYR